MRPSSPSSPPPDLRQTARLIFTEAMDRVELGSALRDTVTFHGSTMNIAGCVYDLQRFTRVLLIAIGKAARPMAEGMVRLLDAALQPGHALDGIVIGTSLPPEPDPRLTYRLGSHPLPSLASMQYGRLVLDRLHQADKATLVLFLISGGASAMIELPLSARISLDDLVDFYRALVHSGLSIAGMNTLRKHISAVKGGRLAVAATSATQCTLLLSDVPPGQADVIGSGLSLPDPSTLEDCHTLLRKHLALIELPRSIRELFADPTLPETPKATHPAFARGASHTLLSSEDLCQAAGAAAAAHGFEAFVDLTCDEWDYQDAAAHLLARLQGRQAETNRPVCLISAGELSVPIPGKPGIGGRNQQFALECARRLADQTTPIAVLSAGSDGLDGNSDAAGAVVDTTTVQRAHTQGFDIDHTLATFNAFPLLHALGDTVVIGPTGNNLRDLRLLLSLPSR